MSRRRSLSFKYRIFGGNLLVAMLPLLLCSTLMLQIFTGTLERQSQEDIQTQGDDLAGQFALALDEGDDALMALTGSKIVQQALVDHISDNLSKDVFLAIYRATNGVPGGAAFAIYDAGGQLQFSTQDRKQYNKLPVHWGLLRKAGQAEGTVYLTIPKTDNPQSDDVCLFMAKSIYSQSGIRVGYAVCSFTRQQLAQVFSGISAERSVLLLLNPQGRILYTSRSGTNEEAAQLRDTMLTGVAAVGYDSADSVFRIDGASGCILIFRQSAAMSIGAVRLMQTISLISAVICLVLCIAISLQLSRSLFSPIGRMSRAMHQVRTGDLSVRIPVGRQDELGQLAENFNAMTGQLDTYVAEQIQHQKDLNDAQIRQMQAQLNPHFLYNTLDTMKWLAKIHNLPEVASLAGNLGGILRSSIASEQFITLDRELELVERYIAIQKIRFSDKFQVVISVPDELRDCVVPKLILQPLVENAIIHGLDGRDSGCIRVCALCQGADFTVAVSDNGCGMLPEMVERLNDPQPKMLEGHLGLYNVSRILQLYYGPGYGLHAVSSQNVGTTVTVCIPVRKEGTNA